jgi:hypothetical protein
VIPDGEFVERLDIDRKLKAALQDRTSETILVYGARGSGKSSQICDTLKGKWGVISFEVKKTGHNDVQDELIESMSTKIGFPFEILPSNQTRISWQTCLPLAVSGRSSLCPWISRLQQRL